MAEDFGFDIPKGKGDGKVAEKEVIFSDKDIEREIETAEKIQTKGFFNVFVIGNDGTGKSGIVLDYVGGLPKKTLIIDLDGGNLPLKQMYHKDNKNIVILNPLKMEATADDIEIDYKMTFAKIKAIIKYVNDHYDNYSAIVLDGISTLLRYAEYQMRLEKNIAADGGVQYGYWKNRNKRFIEVIEVMKNIPAIDKFYIGHEDFILTSDSAAVKNKMNQMMHQRILCIKTDDKAGKVTFTGKIDKSKYNLALEGKSYDFATVENIEDKGKTTWNSKSIWEGLK